MVAPASNAPHAARATSDGDLLARFAQEGVESAFAEVVRRHSGMVLGVCRSVLGDTSDAEDAAQAVFLTLARKARSPAVRAHLVGWLHRVAWYIATRALAARTARRRHEQQAARLKAELPNSEDAGLPMEALHTSLARLPEKYRVPLILHHLEGRSHQETADLVGCSVNALAVRLHRGREMLRQRLSRSGVAAAVALLAVTFGSKSRAPAAAPRFIAGTARAASAVLAGNVQSTDASPQVLAMVDGALGMLRWNRIKTIAATVIVLLLLALGTAWATNRGTPGKNANPPAPPRVVPASGPLLAVTGQITQLTENAISLRRQTGAIETVPFTAATVIKVDDKIATLADLNLQMDAAVLHTNGQPATEIRAYSRSATRPN